MDYYSQFPAPSYEECKRQTITVARLKYKSWAWNPNDEELNALVTEAFMDSGVLEFNNDPNPKIRYSYSGWCVFGKNDVMLILKKELINTSNTATKNKNDPVYKYVFRFSLLGFKNLSFFIIFLLWLFFYYTNSSIMKLTN